LRSRLWQADAYCTALVAASKEAQSTEIVKEVRELARRATFAIKRPDKLAIAQKVAAGASPHLFLVE